MDEVKDVVAELNRLRREFGRENEPFDIMMHCPDADTVDDIRRLEDLGITDLQITPWTVPGSVQVEKGLSSSMQQQPSLAAKQEAIKRYAGEVIDKLR